MPSVIDDCYAGRIRSDYWQQPAYDCQSFMYCAELVICHPLFDPDQMIETLKTRVAHYAPELKHTIVQTFLWHARFTLDNTAKPASRGDTSIVAGCLARAIHCLVLVLYALNETYYLSEKTLALDLRAFRLQPDHFLPRITSLLGAPGTTDTHLLAALARVQAHGQGTGPHKIGKRTRCI